MAFLASDLCWPTSCPTTWKARWIAPQNARGLPSAYFHARKTFNLLAVPSRAILHVAAESIYVLYVNGIPVGRGPVRGTHRVNFFDSYDITRHLHPGQNWVAAAVHCQSKKSFKHSPAEPGVLLQLNDGIITTDETWQVQIAPHHRPDVPFFAYQIGRMEWKDLRAEPIGWQTGQDNGVWESPAILCPDRFLADKDLRPRDIPPLTIEHFHPTDIPLIALTPPLEDSTDTAVAQRMTDEPHHPYTSSLNLTPLLRAGGPPVVIDPPDDGSGVALIFDFAREINGGFDLEIEGPTGAIVDIGYEEELRNGRLRVAVTEYTCADRYILRDGVQHIGNDFSERGYRMVQVVLRNFNRPIHLRAAAAVSRLYPCVKRGTFHSSDSTLNRLWSVCGETLRVCTTDTFVDCPWRENTLYLNDMIVEAITSLQAFGDPRIVERSIRLAVSQVREDHLFPAAVPFGEVPGWTTQASADRMTLTAGNLTFPMLLEEYLLYTGDRALIESVIHLIPPMLAQFESWEDSSGLARPPINLWNFIDWSFPATVENEVTCALEWLRVLALDSTARLLTSLDPARDTRPLSEKSRRIVEAIETRFWNEAEQCYMEGIDQPAGGALKTQLTQAFAILSNRLPRGHAKVLGDALLREDLLAPELFMHHFVLRAMIATGQPQAAMDRVHRYWFPIVQSGSPTIWELGVHSIGKAGFSGAGSLCHGFSTTPIDLLQGAILGIRPTQAGFARCSFAPHAMGLRHAEGRIPTPAGNLHVAWRKLPDGIHARLTLPHGVTVDLPDGTHRGPGRHQLTIPLPAMVRPAPKLMIAKERIRSTR